MTVPDSRPSVEYDALLELCADPVRRVALATLLERPEPIALTELASSIGANLETVPGDRAGGRPDADDRGPSTLPIVLHHTHLPKLADAGLVEYDAERGVVEPTVEFDRVRSLLSSIVHTDPTLETPIVS